MDKDQSHPARKSISKILKDFSDFLGDATGEYKALQQKFISKQKALHEDVQRNELTKQIEQQYDGK